MYLVQFFPSLRSQTTTHRAMRFEIRYVDSSDPSGTVSYPLADEYVEEERKRWTYGLYARDSDGLQWHISDHKNYGSALDALHDATQSFGETVAVMAAWLLAWESIPGQPMPRLSAMATRFSVIDEDSASRMRKTVDLAEAFELAHRGFHWGVSDGSGMPYGGEWREAAEKCVAAFEMNEFQIPKELLP